MSSVFSTRLDEALIERLDRVARALGVPKKQLLEEALRAHLEEIGPVPGEDILDRTAGLWKRRETAATTVRKVRTSFRRGIVRRRRNG